jgi:hypothetical protein
MTSASLAAGVFVVLAFQAAPQTPVKFTTIDRGQQSNIEEARQAVARTAAEWTALWKAHAGDRPRPAIDLTKSMVVAVFLGTRPTGGFEVEITGIEKEGSDLVVTWREHRPARGAMLSQILTMPFHLVSTEKHAGPVRFKKYL